MTRDQWRAVKARMIGMPEWVVGESGAELEREAFIADRCGEQSAAEAIRLLRSGEMSADDLCVYIEAELHLPDAKGCHWRWYAFSRHLAIALGAKP